jgi:hypothetical protein
MNKTVIFAVFFALNLKEMAIFLIVRHIYM